MLTTLERKPSENIVGKGENAGNQHFLLVPQCFLPCQRSKMHRWRNMKNRPLHLRAIWTRLKFSSAEGLIVLRKHFVDVL